jgi:hypothetical protein
MGVASLLAAICSRPWRGGGLVAAAGRGAWSPRAPFRLVDTAFLIIAVERLVSRWF